jgi:CRISPR-associated endonuclease/helicase Cas3
MSRFTKNQAAGSMTPVLGWERCFAKSTENGGAGISVADHCTIAGLLAASLVRLHSSGNLFPEGTSFMVSAHDVGKVSPGFLKHCSNKALETLCPELAAADAEAMGWGKNHAEIGEAAFRAWAESEHGKNSEWTDWAEVIGKHHGSRNFPKNEGVGSYGGPEWAMERKELLNHLFREFGQELPASPPISRQLKLLTGLTCVADWIASNEDFFPNSGINPGADRAELVHHALEECGWCVPQLKQGLGFEEIFSFPPNPMQQAFVECVDRRGVYVLEAPMGLGKTEAALFAAYRLMASGQNSGLYFGLPTRLTSDRIHRRVEAFMDQILVNPGFVKLVHGHAWMNLESHAAEFRAGQSWFHPRKRALLAPFGVGTIDQALMSVLKVKHHFVRTFGLAGKVVVLDEVHSYDAYTGTLLNCLVEELLEVGCSVIILSATLTARRRAELVALPEHSNAYPLISTASRVVQPPSSPDRRVEINCCGNELDPLIEKAVAAAAQGLCVLWIGNTVAQTQDVFCRINGTRKAGSFVTGLLHSRFPAFRRAELEDDWIRKLSKEGSRPSGCILVATQVVEQSVDIDADLLITELAPTDMLLQRMGRLCRHDRKNRPEGAGVVWIYGPEGATWDSAEQFKESLGISRYVYAPYVLWKTIQVWRDRSFINLPSQIREVLETTYTAFDNGPEWIAELKNELDAGRAKLQGAALGLTAIYCGEDDEDSAKTRYNSRPTVQALLLKDCDDCGTMAGLTLCDGTVVALSVGERDFKKAVALHQSMVTLPMQYGFKPVVPAWLKTLVYGQVLVMKMQGENLTDLAGREMPWGYHPDKGVYKREIEQPQTEWKWEDDDESYY